MREACLNRRTNTGLSNFSTFCRGPDPRRGSRERQQNAWIMECLPWHRCRYARRWLANQVAGGVLGSSEWHPQLGLSEPSQHDTLPSEQPHTPPCHEQHPLRASLSFASPLARSPWHRSPARCDCSKVCCVSDLPANAAPAENENAQAIIMVKMICFIKSLFVDMRVAAKTRLWGM